MSAKQPEALRLADLFEVFGTNELAGKAAAELRRLHFEIECMRNAIKKLHSSRGRYHTQIAACDLYDLCNLKNESPTK